MQFSCCIIDKLNDTVTRLTSIVASGRRNVDGVNLEVVQLVAYQLDLKWWRGLCSRSRLGDSDWQLSSVTTQPVYDPRTTVHAWVTASHRTQLCSAAPSQQDPGPSRLNEAEGHQLIWARGTSGGSGGRGKKYTIRYDTVYLTCSKKLTCSQLSPPHRTNRKIKEKNELNINREAYDNSCPVPWSWKAVQGRRSK